MIPKNAYDLHRLNVDISMKVCNHSSEVFIKWSRMKLCTPPAGDVSFTKSIIEHNSHMYVPGDELD
jgi:hypothetical protein